MDAKEWREVEARERSVATEEVVESIEPLRWRRSGGGETLSLGRLGRGEEDFLWDVAPSPLLPGSTLSLLRLSAPTELRRFDDWRFSHLLLSATSGTRTCA